MSKLPIKSSQSWKTKPRLKQRAAQWTRALTPVSFYRRAAAELYAAEQVSERHRHRFEVNNDYRDQLAKAGLTISGTSPDEKLVEMIELTDHPHFVACQFHPEFKSKLYKTSPTLQRIRRCGKSA